MYQILDKLRDLVPDVDLFDDFYKCKNNWIVIIFVICGHYCTCNFSCHACWEMEFLCDLWLSCNNKLSQLISVYYHSFQHTKLMKRLKGRNPGPQSRLVFHLGGTEMSILEVSCIELWSRVVSLRITQVTSFKNHCFML